MSGTCQDSRLRLVPLIDTLASISKPMLDLDQILDLAIKGEVQLYVQLPSDKVAYVDDLLPVITHRRSSRYVVDASWHVSQYSPEFSQIHPEVSHLALDPDQAEELKTSGLSAETAFSSGLTPHHDSALAQAGWWLPCQFGASLVICPTAVKTGIETKRLIVRRKLLKTMPKDVYVDERVATMLEYPQASIQDDPLYLQKRAPGVYVLYCAAAKFYEQLKKAKNLEETARIKSDLKSELRIKEPKLFTEESLRQAVKLINPLSRRGSGISKKPKQEEPVKPFKAFDADLLAKTEFRLRYRRGSFITDAMALILYATDWWRDECIKHEAAKAMDKNLLAERPSIIGLIDELERVGFYGPDELAAVARIVMWSDR